MVVGFCVVAKVGFFKSLFRVEEEIWLRKESLNNLDYSPTGLSNELIFCKLMAGVDEVRTTFEACRRADILQLSARQLKPIEKLMLKLTTKAK